MTPKQFAAISKSIGSMRYVSDCLGINVRTLQRLAGGNPNFLDDAGQIPSKYAEAIIKLVQELNG